jgi:hypothetical protein
VKLFGKPTATEITAAKKKQTLFFVLEYCGIFSTYQIRWIRTRATIIFYIWIQDE